MRGDPGAGAERVQGILARWGGRFSSELGIDLDQGAAQEIFKWFLAALLYGARIAQPLAGRTYREFERAGVLSPQAIQRTGWNGLVAILDRGGYARYDFKTATKLLAASQALLEQYGGDLNRLHDAARDAADLEARLRSLAKGIGAVTANIFLRELRGIWEKARPLPCGPAVAAARELKLVPGQLQDGEVILERLQALWAKAAAPGRFADFEAALVRCGIRRKGAHQPQ